MRVTILLYVYVGWWLILFRAIVFIYWAEGCFGAIRAGYVWCC